MPVTCRTIRRDAVLLRVIGSPDPYGKQIDGLGAATSSTNKVVLVRRSPRFDCDVAYLFGQSETAKWGEVIRAAGIKPE